MKERIEEELRLLRQEYPDLEYREEGRWIRLPRYRLPPGIWNREETEVCFQIPDAYPGQAPYGFYVPGGLLLKDTNQPPNNYGPAATPFPGSWCRFSWQHDNWRATADVKSGSNLLNFVRTFKDRFKEGA